MITITLPLWVMAALIVMAIVQGILNWLMIRARIRNSKATRDLIDKLFQLKGLEE